MKLSSIRSGRPIVTAMLLSSLALAAACGGSESSPIAPSTPGASLPGGGSGGGTSGPTSTPDNLLGQWTLATVVRDGVSETVPKGTGSFNVTFGSDGRVGMRADCNVCTSTYQADAGGILISPTAACTLAYCTTAPFDQRYVGSVVGSTGWQVAGDRLVLTSPTAVLTFQRASN